MATNTGKASLEQEAQSLQAYMNEYSQQFELMSQQLRFIETARAEALASVDAIEAVSSSKGEVDSLLNLGGGVSVRAKVTDTKRMIVGIGAGVSVEKSAEDAVSYLKDRVTEMDASAKRLAESLGKLEQQVGAVQKRMDEISRIYASGMQ
ncbi:MAG: prefoldin subunit alpha [Methanocorpusculum sp.]|nr:prefoldin subunit alpha [Methanocorpusculum sp.]